MSHARLDVTMYDEPPSKTYDELVQALDAGNDAFPSGALTRRGVSLDRFPFAIGSSKTNDLVVTGSTYVSRDHAEIVTNGTSFVLHDRNSRFGTFVNGRQITRHRLAHGDTITFGQDKITTLVFFVDDGSANVSGSPPRFPDAP